MVGQRPKILILGSLGQTGHCLRGLANGSAFEFVFWDKDELDLSQPDTIPSRLASVAPKLVINLAAYTDVEKSEVEIDRARQINGAAVGVLAKTLAALNSRLVHISTDYVFDGLKSCPYEVNDSPNPINAYGRSKLEGEQKFLEAGVMGAIIRTSWLYSEFGGNFLLKILGLLKDRPEIKIVADQVGSPTYAKDLASFILLRIPVFLEMKESKIFHFTNEGCGSWYDFAFMIDRLVNSRKIVIPIKSDEFPTRAQRPKMSILSKGSLLPDRPRHWVEALEDCIKQIQM